MCLGNVQRSHSHVGKPSHACCGPGMLLLCRDAAAGTERQQLFLVSQRRGPPQLLAMASDLSKQFQVPLIAWGAVAADITKHSPTGSSSSSGDGSGAQEGGGQVAPGRAFCFLPLPALTSLPVHINGFFELSSNRCVLGLDHSALNGSFCVYLQSNTQGNVITLPRNATSGVDWCCSRAHAF